MDVAMEEASIMNGGAAPVTPNGPGETGKAPGPEGAQPKVRFSPGAQVVGEIVGLLSQSSFHRHLFLADLEWLIGPPVALRQFRIFHDEKKPLAVALWAAVSDEVEKELIAGRPRLRPNEWKSGDNLWMIDLIAPALTDKPKLVEGLISELSEKAFARKAFKMRTRDPKTGEMKVVVVKPTAHGAGSVN